MIYKTANGFELPEIDPTKKFPIEYYPNGMEFLGKESRPVDKEQATDEDIHRQIAFACQTMYDSKGVGVAFPQIGVNRRVVIIDTQWIDTGEPVPLVLVNPEIVETFGEKKSQIEGCLSIPLGYSAPIKRYEKVKIKYRDLDFKSRTKTLKGLAAQCIQHEIDHLNGVLFIDHLSRLKRQMYDNKLKKLQKRVYLTQKTQIKHIQELEKLQARLDKATCKS